MENDNWYQMWEFCFRAYWQRKCCQGRAERSPEQACLEQSREREKIPGECSTVLHLKCSLPGRLFSIPKFMSVSPLRLPRPLAGCSHSQRFCLMCVQQVLHAPATWGYVLPQPRTLPNQRSTAWSLQCQLPPEKPSELPDMLLLSGVGESVLCFTAGSTENTS